MTEFWQAFHKEMEALTEPLKHVDWWQWGIVIVIFLGAVGFKRRYPL